MFGPLCTPTNVLCAHSRALSLARFCHRARPPVWPRYAGRRAGADSRAAEWTAAPRMRRLLVRRKSRFAPPLAPAPCRDCGASASRAKRPVAPFVKRCGWLQGAPMRARQLRVPCT
eukprot:6198934-Pleurochrysis_carterae.AAC.6